MIPALAGAGWPMRLPGMAVITWVWIGGVVVAAGIAAWAFMQGLHRAGSARVSLVQGGQAGDLHRFSLRTASGAEHPLAQYRGRPVLLVNVASKCGYTGQYEGLEALHRKRPELVLIGVPSNDFLGQEPGSNSDIQAFCRLTYGVSFPVMAKEPVRGASAHPLYAWIAADSPAPGPIEWNFTKVLFDAEGRLVARFGPKVGPDDPRLLAAIDALSAAR